MTILIGSGDMRRNRKADRAELLAQPYPTIRPDMSPPDADMSDEDVHLILAVRTARVSTTLASLYYDRIGMQPDYKVFLTAMRDHTDEPGRSSNAAEKPQQTIQALWLQRMRLAYAYIYCAENSLAKGKSQESTELLAQAMYWIGVVVGSRGSEDDKGYSERASATLPGHAAAPALLERILQGAREGGRRSAITRRRKAVSSAAVRQAAAELGWPAEKSGILKRLALKFDRTPERIGQILNAK